MSKLTRSGALIAALIFASGLTLANAATKTKPKPKTTTQPHYVQGTTQLKGEYAEMGKTYTLGKEDPLNINLKSAEYTIEPIKIGETSYVPTADEKLLVLHFTYHNPQPRERFTRWDSFDFTIVDPQDENHEGLVDLGMEKDKSTCSMDLKPAQKIDVYGVMRVPAKGEMPKLIIKSSDQLVLRYNLKGKVKGLSEPYADTSDKTGATALAKVPANMGVYYPLSNLEVKLDKVEYSIGPTMGETELDESEVFLVATITAKNVGTSPEFMRWDSFDGKIIDVDGVEAADCVDMFQKSKDKTYGGDVQPGQELTVRCIFKMPDDTDVKTLSMHYDANRTFLFDISNIQK